MKLLVSIGHPAHVHVFKNLIWEMEKRGHEIKICARNKDVAKKLLDAYNFDYSLISDARSSTSGLAIEMMARVKKFLLIIRDFNPDVVLSLMDPSVAIAAKILRKRYISLADTEHAKLTIKTTLPFTDAILTPSCFKKDLGKKQIRYNGYHELAYLHPNYFTPNPAVLDELGLSKEDTFVILRFVSWSASHDVGHTGLTLQTKRNAVHEFEKYGRVLITSESPLPKEFEKYRITVSPEKIHDLMYYATLLYGESATMASECAVLGTHAIFSDFAGRGYTDEEEEKYGLVFNFKLDEESQRKSLEKAVELLENSNLKSVGKKKREKLLKDKIDVTKWMTDLIINYPDSVELIRRESLEVVGR